MHFEAGLIPGYESKQVSDGGNYCVHIQAEGACDQLPLLEADSKRLTRYDTYESTESARYARSHPKRKIQTHAPIALARSLARLRVSTEEFSVPI
jgi:hypothetical protein